MDGHAVWSIRNFKWMELGFSEDYMLRLLSRCGFAAERSSNTTIGPLGMIYIGTKFGEAADPKAMLLPAAEEASFGPPAPDKFRFCGPNSMISVADLCYSGNVDVILQNHLTVPLKANLTLGLAYKSVTLPKWSNLTVTLPMRAGCGPLKINSQTACPRELGINDDPRQLGVEVQLIRYSA